MLYALARRYRHFYTPIILLLFVSSCTTLRNYPANKPFVYKTNIDLKGAFSTEERKRMTAELQQQLADSMQVRSVSKLIGWKGGPRLFYTEIVSPPVYDSINAARSIQFMRALLNAQGYFRDSISYDTTLKINGDQQRTTVDFIVVPGRLTTLDSVWYNMGNDTLQKITTASLEGSPLQKGAPFSKSLISTELNRLADVYRNNGYLRFSVDELIAVYDTVGIDLLRPTLDPLEQARQLQELQRRRESPTADVELRLRANQDSSHLVQYHVGNVTIYPDLGPDTARFAPQTSYSRGARVVSYGRQFKPNVVTENIYLRRGQLYSRNIYNRTLNRLNSIGAWRLVSIDPLPRDGEDTVDFAIRMIPARKYQTSVNLEGSQNRGNIFVGQFGLGINAGLNNRNMARAANQASTNLRYGIELGSASNVQTQIITLGHTISFPRIIPRFGFIPENRRDNFRTIFNFSLNNTDRFNYFNLSAVNLSWGYEYSWRNKLLNLRLPSLEYSNINKRDSLLNLEKRIVSYRYIFNDGLVSSLAANYTVTGGTQNVTNQKRIGFEASGLLSGFLNNDFIDTNLYRFIRVDAEFRQTHRIRRSAFAWRVFGGAGYGMPRFDGDNKNLYLPFFKQYIAGGPNSMRAWGLRKLGPGSNNTSTAIDVAPERFGDLQLEANAEYRFPMISFGSMQINGAVFTDIGNIWFLRKNPDFENGEFRLDRLGRDIAIGSGLGLRIDFGFFLARLEYAYRVKDPALPNGNTWFYDWKLLNGQLQFGINYPF